MSPTGDHRGSSGNGTRAAGNGASQGLLFSEDLPVLDEDAGYRGPIVCKAAGITYRQLDYWARTGLVEPAVRGASGSGTQRLYSFRDILVLKVVKRLLDTGVSLQQIRTAVSHLRERGVEDLAQITLMSDGASVYECTSADEVIDLVQGGQECSASPSDASGARSRAACPPSPASMPPRSSPRTNWASGGQPRSPPASAAGTRAPPNGAPKHTTAGGFPSKTPSVVCRP